IADFATYSARERPPVCVAYRVFKVCGMGPPSSAGLTVGEILGTLEPYDLAALGPASPAAWRLIADASRLAFADRDRYIADDDFVPVPAAGLLDPAYLRARAALLKGDRALPSVLPGEPHWSHARLEGDGAALELPSTTHFSIIDRDGNVVAVTSSIESAFGARLMVDGFMLNNELTDFSFATHDAAGRPIANAVAPGKRPRSSMAPTIVFRDGRPVLAIGTPGGSAIIGLVAKALIGWMDWHLDVQQAIDLPNVLDRFGPVEIERGTAAEKLAAPLRAMGFAVRPEDIPSGFHGIAIFPGRLEGGADPRRAGVAVGG
ncbi:MAG TPA: gamma-glutamyltransferase, partial [Hyphomicrobiales bacterium]|nr:gamma-glutamyltransferase [Hyphomicrobiales bacterium]